MNDQINTVRYNFNCTFCGQIFSRYFNLKRHLKLVHNQPVVHDHQQWTLKEGETLKEFNNFSEFMSWKEFEEKVTKSMYVRQRGNGIRKNGDKIIYYHCSRSGFYKPKGKGLKNLKSQGSSKIGSICPAKMRVRLTSEKVVVHYFPKHENHEMQLEHLRLSQCDRTDIAELVRVVKQDNLHLIAINRPEKRNCVNPDTASQLKTAFQNFEDDSNALVAILHGMGGTFCAGYDLKEVAAANTSALTATDGPMGPSKMLLKKPVIAAIDGHAVAGGFELALWCDLRVVEETAIMGVFCRRFGVPLIDGGTVRLPKIIGLGRALDLILTGRGISGKEANDMGLVTKLCKKGQALETAINLANELCKFPQNCMNADRLSAYNATYNSSSIDEALKYETEHSLPVLVESVKGAEQFVKGVGRHGQSLEKPIFQEDRQNSKL